MKFIATLILALAIVGTISVTSCRKNRTCHCTVHYTGSPGLPDSSVEEFSIQNTKNGAASTCKAQSQTYDNTSLGIKIKSVENCYIY